MQTNKNINMKIMDGLKLIESLDEIFRVKWKPVPSHPHYYVSNRGQVENKRTGQRLKPRACDIGVQLYKDGKCQFKSIYKLVEELFTHNDAVRAFVSIAHKISWDCVDTTKSYGYINVYCAPKL